MTVLLPLTPPIPQIYSIAYIVAYVFLVVGVVEQFHSRGVISDLTSRNIVGLGVIPCVLVAPWLFTDWYWVLAASVLFLAITTLSMKFGLLSSVDAERGRFGGVAMAIVLCVSVFIGWFFTDLGRGIELRPLAAFSVFPSTVADSLAAMVGRRYGKGELRRKRSKIGTAAGVLGGVAAFVIANLVFGFTGWLYYLLAVGFGALTGLAELVSPVQLDNLVTGIVAGVGGYLILTLG
jgi:dolichol kinase